MIPRIVIAGTSSGAGKTTVACGLMGALRQAGHRVQGFKVGPDFIDPSYHALACGRPGRNLDAFLSGPQLIAPLVEHGGADADIAVVEGVMGLFDGASGRGEFASTAHVAKLLDAPVLLVVNAASMARSVAAIVHGYRSFDTDVRIAGVVLNQVGSDRHAEILREALEPLEIPVVGTLHRDASIVTPERHLGLVPAGERAANASAALEALTSAARGGFDLEQIAELARSAPSGRAAAWAPTGDGTAAGGRIAVASGAAFSFFYEENLELLRAAGAELIPFDPLIDEQLPAEAGGLILAGGFPEIYASELTANAPLRGAVTEFARSGRPILAECGGLMYLASDIDGQKMCDVIPTRVRMGGRLTLGYREATAATPTPWLAAGERINGHEFHYSQADEAEGWTCAWTLRAHGEERTEGFARGAVQASYLHTHWAAYPDLAQRFARAALAAEVVV
jgi:cobyrinic acid a,c-diamide synthase